MKKLLITLLATIAVSQASTVTLSSLSTGPSVFLADGSTLVPNGSLIRVGTLTTPGNAATFVEFGTSTVKNAGIGGGARPSKIIGAVANATEDDDAQFNGLPVYIWIYNATSLPADQASREAIPQGLFRSETFNFPANDLAGVGDAVTPTAVSFLTSVNLPFVAIQASVNMTGDNGTGNATGGRFLLSGIIPEPSSIAVLLATAGFGLARRRRK